tara:strand:- start:1101 stop:1343 length:243 start_codon:yes stop_codon:yes gene_type:complete
MSKNAKIIWPPFKVKKDKKGRIFSADFNNFGSFYTKIGKDGYQEFLDFLNNGYRPEKKPGRNEKCPCGSGLKYKKCCGNA